MQQKVTRLVNLLSWSDRKRHFLRAGKVNL